MNQQAFEDFWFFINERHRIFLKKWRGDPKPWTEYEIFQNWRFCNVFRKYDRQSKLLIDNVIKPHWNDDLALMLFNIYAFRAFNLINSYEWLSMGLSNLKEEHWISSWDPKTAIDTLQERVGIGRKLTSGAYMIRGREGMPKYESIVQTLTDIWNHKGQAKLDLVTANRSLEAWQKNLMDMKFWGWGSFTTYQIVLDLTYTKWLENAVDINTWCEFGPGAIRGIREIFPDIPKSRMITTARGLLYDANHHLESHVPPLTLQDIEFCLCELQKYRRIKAGGRSKEKYPGVA